MFLDIPSSGAAGSQVPLKLRAPIDHETAYVIVTNQSTGTSEKVMLESEGDNVFSALYTLPDSPAITVSYGYGLFRQGAEISIV